MPFRSLLIASITAATLAACAPWTPPPAGNDPFARLRGHDVYGLVTSLGPTDVVPDLRSTERCAARDENCEVLLSEGGRYQYASVQLSGALKIDRVIVLKGQPQVGDIVRFTLAKDRNMVPLALEVGARAARRKGSNCDWVDGSPEAKTGGVVCKGWSYREADAR